MTVHLDRHLWAHILGASCRLLGVGQRQRGRPSLGGIAGQAIGMGRRVLLRECGTQAITLEYNLRHTGIRRLREVDALP